MDKHSHHIDKLFQPELEGYEELPSEAYFHRMEAALDERQQAKHTKKGIAWKQPVLFIVLMLCSLIIYEAQIVDRKNSLVKHSAPNQIQLTNINQDAEVEDLPVAHQPAKDKQELLTLAKNGSIGFVISGSKQDNFTTRLNNSFAKNISEYNAGDSSNEKQQEQSRLPVEAFFIKGIQKNINATTLFNNPITIPAPLFNFTTTKEFDNGKNAATGKKPKRRKFLWEISPFISYEQAGYNLQSDLPLTVNRISFSEAHEPSFSAGLLLSRSVTKRFSVQPGITFRQMAVGMKPQKVYAFNDPTGNVAFKYITSSGYAYFTPKFGVPPSVGDSLTTAEGKHILENISIPLMLGYTVIDKKFYVKPLAGVEASFITKANLEVDIEDAFNKEIVQVKRLSGVNTVYWSFVAGGEIGYHLNKKLSLNVRPLYRVALSPITKNNRVETYPKSFGIGAGVSIRF